MQLEQHGWDIHALSARRGRAAGWISGHRNVTGTQKHQGARPVLRIMGAGAQIRWVIKTWPRSPRCPLRIDPRGVTNWHAVRSQLVRPREQRTTCGRYWWWAAGTP